MASDNKNWAESLIEPYPDVRNWKTYTSAEKREVFAFAGLWITGGIPFAFKEEPLRFQKARLALARRINVDPQSVCMTGSGQLGSSLAYYKFGQEYNSESDIDLFVVSSDLFGRMCSDALLFAERIKSGMAKSEDTRIQALWEENARLIPIHAAKGFVNQWFVPDFDRYKHIQDVSNSLTLFNRVAAGRGDGGDKYRRTSLRSYKDWDAAISQIGGTLCRNMESIGIRIE